MMYKKSEELSFYGDVLKCCKQTYGQTGIAATNMVNT